LKSSSLFVSSSIQVCSPRYNSVNYLSQQPKLYARSVVLISKASTRFKIAIEKFVYKLHGHFVTDCHFKLVHSSIQPSYVEVEIPSENKSKPLFFPTTSTTPLDVI